MQTTSFAGMFDRNADQWARQEPLILSDFTARPVVLDELAPLVLGAGRDGRLHRELDALSGCGRRQR